MIGTPGNDRVTLGYYSINPDVYRFIDGNKTVVMEGGVDIKTVVFQGFAGDDYFKAYPFVNLETTLIYGHAGNDELIGPSGLNTTVINGGEGDDIIIGGRGNDVVRNRLIGGPGNDEIYGGDRDDLILGGDGENLLMGSWGNDLIFGGSDKDTIYGDGYAPSARGNDILVGFGGDDIIHTGLGSLDQTEDQAELVFGGDGDDLISSGEPGHRHNETAGFWKLYGGNGHDTIYGDIGENKIFGQAGDDIIGTGKGNDFVDGGPGKDQINQPEHRRGQQGGFDEILGNVDDDIITGLGDENIIFGGPGDDLIYGGDGNDSLIGNDGDDILDGGEGVDSLNGGAGNDGLFGGINESNYLNGGPGADRLLKFDSDRLGTVASEDAVLAFKNKSLDWTVGDVRTLDLAFDSLHRKTGGTTVLKDSLSPFPITFVKSAQATSKSGLNTLWKDGSGNWRRQISIREWDFANRALSVVAQLTVIHEMGHNWDSAFEISARLPGAAGMWQDFLNLSFWSTVDKGDLYFKSSDATKEAFETGFTKWWYRGNTQFILPSGNASPQEDWATSWESVFFAEIGEPYANDRVVVSKTNHVSRFLSLL